MKVGDLVYLCDSHEAIVHELKIGRISMIQGDEKSISLIGVVFNGSPALRWVKPEKLKKF